MGVKGLQTFLKNNSDLLSQKIHVSNTNLVIDANNLMCFIFFKIASDKESKYYKSDIYGADMTGYGEQIELFFKNLEKCNITPILVFDGSVIGKQSTQAYVVLKDKETYRRGLDKFNRARLATEDYNPTEFGVFLPKIINTVFKNYVNDLGTINTIQCAYEADTHIARIANDLNCPVLTNDSDFFIYPLKQGFILLDNFQYENLNNIDNKKFSINCQIFKQNLLVKVLPGLKIENMPLLSILLGNDFIESKTFDRILEPILRRSYYGKLRADSFNHKKIANLLDWIKDKTYTEAIDYILNQVRPSSRDNLLSTLKILNRNYRIELVDNLEEELKLIYPTNKDPRNNISPDQEANYYYKKLFEKGTLASCLLDIIFHNTNYHYPTIDDFQLVTSSYIRYRPFAVAVTLLRPCSYSKLTTYRKQIQAETDALRLFDRVDGEYRELIIRPIEFLDGYGSLEHVNAYSLITLMPEFKKKILKSTFRYNNEEESLIFKTFQHIFSDFFSKEATLCFLLIKYIGLETKSKPKQEFVDAVLLTIFYYASIQGQINCDKIKDSQYGAFLLKLRPHSITDNKIQYKPSVGLFRRISHFISQLMYAYSGYDMLNGLLGRICYMPKLEKFFNSVLIFRLTKLFKQKELETKCLCGDMRTLFDVCEIIRTITQCEA